MYPPADYAVRSGDTAPRIEGTLTDGLGEVVAVTGADVRLYLRGLTVANDLGRRGYVVTGRPGTVAYDWQDGDLDVSGYYAQTWELTLANGQVQTFPNDGHNIVRISENDG